MVKSNISRKLNVLFPILIVTLALCALMFYSAAAIESAQAGLSTCARIIIPSLLPFYVLSGLLAELGLPSYLGRFCAPLMIKLFGVRGPGVAAFILGLSGGYPLGASTVIGLYKDGTCDKNEAERLLGFCNNSGPAFILGAAGVGIWKSSSIGLCLFVVHIISAVLVGILFSRGSVRTIKEPIAIFKAESFPGAFAKCVKSAVASTITVCTFVIFFSVIVGVLDALGIFTYISGNLAYYTGLELAFVRSLLTGLLELGSGIGSMENLSAALPLNIALSAFILGWGGLSVHCQVLSLAEGTDLSLKKHFLGKLFHGLISAVLILVIYSLA